MTRQHDPQPRNTASRRRLLALGVLVHIAVGALPYSVSGLVAPPEGVALLWGSWFGLLVAAVLLAHRGHLLVLAVPAVALGWWALVVSVGDAMLGWTA
jgi:hypothetical protein